MLPTGADLASKSTTMENNSVVFRSISMETPPTAWTQIAQRALYKDGRFKRKLILPNLSVSSIVALTDKPLWPVAMEAAELPSLPIYLEKNCSTVIKKASPSEIARRIVRCLHRISAAALICEGNSSVKRRRGDSLSFHRDCCKILDAAVSVSTNNCSTQVISLKIPPSIKCPLNSIEQKKNATESLHNIALMLGQGSMLYETVQLVLVMEQLCSLTNPEYFILFRKQPKMRNDFVDNFGDIYKDLTNR